MQLGLEEQGEERFGYGVKEQRVEAEVALAVELLATLGTGESFGELILAAFLRESSLMVDNSIGLTLTLLFFLFSKP